MHRSLAICIFISGTIGYRKYSWEVYQFLVRSSCLPNSHHFFTLLRIWKLVGSRGGAASMPVRAAALAALLAILLGFAQGKSLNYVHVTFEAHLLHSQTLAKGQHHDRMIPSKGKETGAAPLSGKQELQ